MPVRSFYRARLLAAAVLSAIAAPACVHAAEPPAFTAPRVRSDYLAQLGRLPDWNGVWQPMGGFLYDPGHAYVPPDPAGATGGMDPGLRQGTRLTAVPYKPEYQKQYDETIKRGLAGESTDTVGSCMRPHGIPRNLGGAPGPIEIIVLPGQVRFTWDYFNATQRIYTDGRPHPSGDDVYPSHMGHSIGHWDGDALVTDTVNLLEGVYDGTGAPYSDKVHVTERIRMIAPDRLELAITADDPVMLTRPYTVVRTYRRVAEPKAQTLGYYCQVQGTDLTGGVQNMILSPDAAAPQAAEPKGAPK